MQAHPEEGQLPTASVPQMRKKGIITVSQGGAENPERIMESSGKPKSIAGKLPDTTKLPDTRKPSVARHTAKKAKPDVRPDVSSFPFCCTCAW